jgi:hypothetical protein
MRLRPFALPLPFPPLALAAALAACGGAPKNGSARTAASDTDGDTGGASLRVAYPSVYSGTSARLAHRRSTCAYVGGRAHRVSSARLGDRAAQMTADSTPHGLRS